MHKYMILEGIDGVLVPDPDMGHMRFVGQKRKPGAKDAKTRAEMFEPTIQAKEWDPTWVKAVKKKKLKLHKIVVAENGMEALVSIPEVKAKMDKDAEVAKAKKKAEADSAQTSMEGIE